MLSGIDYNQIFGESRIFQKEEVVPKKEVVLERSVKDRTEIIDGIAKWIIPPSEESQLTVVETEESLACREFELETYLKDYEFTPRGAISFFESSLLSFSDYRSTPEFFAKSGMSSLDTKIVFLVGASLRYYQWTLARFQVETRIGRSVDEKNEKVLQVMENTPCFSHFREEALELDPSLHASIKKVIEICTSKYTPIEFISQQLASHDPGDPLRLLRDHIIVWLQDQELDPNTHRYLLSNPSSSSPSEQLNQKGVWYCLSQLNQESTTPLFIPK